MSYVSVDEAKEHLLVIHDSDDLLIQQNIDAAEAYAAHYMNRPAIEDNPLNPWKRNSGTVTDWLLPPNCHPQPVVSSESEDPVPRSVVQAVLLLVGDFYENRTASIVGTIVSPNPAAENLLWQQRIGMGI